MIAIALLSAVSALMVAANECDVCAVDGGCKRVSGLFSRQQLEAGHNRVIRVPRGACRVNVTATHDTINFLAVRETESREFVFNGGQDATPADSQSFRVGNAVIRYYRPGADASNPREHIYIDGPTSVALDILVFARQANRGIFCSFLVPPPTEGARGDRQRDVMLSDAPDDRYQRYAARLRQWELDRQRFRQQQISHKAALSGSIPGFIPPSQKGPPPVAIPTTTWHVAGYTECSHSCGEGTQLSLVVCIRTDTQTTIPDSYCDVRTKPEPTPAICNAQPCLAEWVVGEWGECCVDCERVVRSRSVECQRRLSGSMLVTVALSECDAVRRPPDVDSCEVVRRCRWQMRPWSTCSAQCGRGHRTRDVICVDYEGATIEEASCHHLPRPPASRSCDMGACPASTWYYTEWSDRCGARCGASGVYSRHVYCPAADHCSALVRPNATRPCSARNGQCDCVWYAGPWSDCSADCGRGVESREVVCMRKTYPGMQVVADGNCRRSDRPDSERPCDGDECHSAWYMTDWSPCSSSCGSGTQVRQVQCLTSDQAPASDCDYARRPPMRQACSGRPCPDIGALMSPVIVGRGPSSTCRDRLGINYCRLMVQGRICRYNYYREQCCSACQHYDVIHPPDDGS